MMDDRVGCDMLEFPLDYLQRIRTKLWEKSLEAQTLANQLLTLTLEVDLVIADLQRSNEILSIDQREAENGK